jgi:hypothetical protein
MFRLISRAAVLLVLVLGVVSGSPAIAATSPNAVRGFVYEWFSLFDRNADPEAFLERLDTDHLEIAFPERTLRSAADFRAWYQGILTTYAHATHDI